VTYSSDFPSDPAHKVTVITWLQQHDSVTIELQVQSSSVQI